MLLLGIVSYHPIDVTLFKSHASHAKPFFHHTLVGDCASWFLYEQYSPVVAGTLLNLFERFTYTGDVVKQYLTPIMSLTRIPSWHMLFLQLA